MGPVSLRQETGAYAGGMFAVLFAGHAIGLPGPVDHLPLRGSIGRSPPQHDQDPFSHCRAQIRASTHWAARSE